MHNTSHVRHRWELLWTTEKETLFFAKYGLFGESVTRISQTIDINSGYLNNLIEFNGDRYFSVIGKIRVDTGSEMGGSRIGAGRRIFFDFKKAKLAIPPIPVITLPPVGKGWFDTLYVNDRYRLSKDIRGDYLLSRRL